MTESKSVEKKSNKEKESQEARNNLLGFFKLLLEVDMRVNHQRYKVKKKIYQN